MAYNIAMKSEVAQKINSLNYQFYQSFADDFSETRGRLQPGVLRVLERLQPGVSILDLGCGNVEVAHQLAEAGFSGSYLGTDFSDLLLQKGSLKIPTGYPADFIQLDLTEPDWDTVLPYSNFDVIFCFAALHHIPSHSIRLAVCKNFRRYITHQGLVYLSNWQFLKSERLKERIIPWDSVGLSDDQVDKGDYLLDWRRGGTGTRYVHHFTPAELGHLAEAAGFKIIESFDSDGKEGNLSLYQIWESL